MSAAPIVPQPSWSRFDQIASEVLNYAEVLTSVALAIPSPATPFAAPALIIEKLLGSLIQTHAAVKGQTVEATIAALHQIAPLP